MDSHGIKQNLIQQVTLLNNEKIVNESNRQGLRRKTGDLLEAAFIDLVLRLSPALSLEIGAHEAGYSQSIKQKLPNTRCVAYEANHLFMRNIPVVLPKILSTGTWQSLIPTVR